MTSFSKSVTVLLLSFFIVVICIYLLSLISFHTVSTTEAKVKNPPVILIQPFGSCPPQYIDSVRFTLTEYYNAKVYINEKVSLPQIAYYSSRKRYRADSLIRFLRRIKPDSVDKIIGVSLKDISTKKGKYKDYGIQGLAFLNGASCVISTYRLKRYARENNKVFFKSLKIVSRHEIGHTFGISHCENSETCFMISSRGGARTIKNAGINLCDSCRKKLLKSNYLFVD